jgi:hypothetical protein
MGTRDSDIGIGDVVRAWIRLGAHAPDERALVANLLGFDYTFTVKERTRTRKGDPAVAASAGAPDGGSSSTSAEPGRDLAASVALPLERIALQTAVAKTTPDWLQIDRPLQPELPQHLNVRLPHQPLFRTGWTRAILSTACATSSPHGPIDMARLVDALSQCRPVTELPREPMLSLGRGIELLVDRGDNLMPFARDIRDLQQQLQLVAGRDRTRIGYFDGCPILGCGPAARSTWKKRYEPPPPETPIVAITDLGMARGSAARTSATHNTWLKFFQMVRSAGCPLIVFAPYPLSRWPKVLSKAVRAIPWDRPTTVSIARQAVRRDGDHG